MVTMLPVGREAAANSLTVAGSLQLPFRYASLSTARIRSSSGLSIGIITASSKRGLPLFQSFLNCSVIRVPPQTAPRPLIADRAYSLHSPYCSSARLPPDIPTEVPMRLIVLLVALSCVLPSSSIEAQGTVPKVGWIEAGSRSANQHFLDAFRQGLRDLQYVEGQNIVIEDRWADGRAERFPELLAELIRSKVDVIVVASTPGASAAKRSEISTPVVFWGVSDPVGIGLVASLGHPGGNITGVALGTEDGLPGKWVELLREAVPNATRLAMLWN